MIKTEEELIWEQYILFESFKDYITKHGNTPDVKDLVDIFKKERNRLSPPENDIGFWMNKPVDNLKDFLDNLPDSKRQQLKKQKSFKGNQEILNDKDVDLIHSDDDWIVMGIKNFEGAKRWGGQTTDWCVTKTEGHYNSYVYYEGSETEELEDVEYLFVFAFDLTREPYNIHTKEGDPYSKLALQIDRSGYIESIHDAQDNNVTNHQDIDVFKFQHLSEEWIKKTLPKSLLDIYEENGGELNDLLKTKISELPDFLEILDNDTVLFSGWNNVSDFIGYIDDNDMLKTYLPYITGEECIGNTFNSYDYRDKYYIEDLYQAICEKHPEFKEKMKKHIFSVYGEEAKNYDYESGSLDNSKNQVDFLYEQDDDIKNQLSYAYVDGIISGSEGELYKEFMRALKAVEISDDKVSFVPRFEYIDDEVKIEGTVHDVLKIYRLIVGYNGLSNLVREDSFDIKHDFSEPRYGFQGYDETVAIERFMELLDEEGYFELSNEEIKESKETIKYLKYF